MCLCVLVQKTSTLAITFSFVDPERFFRGGPTLATCFLVDGGREDPNTNYKWAIIGRQRNAI